MPALAGPLARRCGPTLALLALGAAAASAQAVGGYPARGLELAQRFCSTCHLVAPGGTGPTTAGIPTFPAMAGVADLTAERLASRMMAPHPPMPEVPLTVREMQDLAAYIRSLRQPR